MLKYLSYDERNWGYVESMNNIVNAKLDVQWGNVKTS